RPEQEYPDDEQSEQSCRPGHGRPPLHRDSLAHDQTIVCTSRFLGSDGRCRCTPSNRFRQEPVHDHDASVRFARNEALLVSRHNQGEPHRSHACCTRRTGELSSPSWRHSSSSSPRAVTTTEGPPPPPAQPPTRGQSHRTTPETTTSPSS